MTCLPNAYAPGEMPHVEVETASAEISFKSMIPVLLLGSLLLNALSSASWMASAARADFGTSAAAPRRSITFHFMAASALTKLSARSALLLDLQCVEGVPLPNESLALDIEG